MESSIETLYAAAQGAHTYRGKKTSVKANENLGKCLYPHQKAALDWMLHMESRGCNGILADGPGLGKTLTMLTVISKDKTKRQEIKKTLIISPNEILQEHWIRELESTRSKRSSCSPSWWDIYKGLPQNATKEDALPHIAELQSKQLTFVTMQVLSREYNYYFAETNARENASNQYICPLYQISWHRICVDEVQEVEKMASKASKMASCMNSVHRWGVSGTPISRGLADLKGLAAFLDVQPYCDNAWWNREMNNEELLKGFIKKVMWRTPFAFVEKQLLLPPQTHLPVRFLSVSAVEFAYYLPKFQHFSSIVESKLRSYRADSSVVTKSDVTHVLANEACRSLLCGANHPILATTSASRKRSKNEISSSNTNYNNVLTSDLLVQLVSKLRQEQRMELELLVQFCVSVPPTTCGSNNNNSLAFQINSSLSAQENVYCLLKNLSTNITIKPTIYLLLLWYLSAFHKSLDTNNNDSDFTKHIMRHEQYYKSILMAQHLVAGHLSYARLVPKEVWPIIFSYLPSDFEAQFDVRLLEYLKEPRAACDNSLHFTTFEISDDLMSSSCILSDIKTAVVKEFYSTLENVVIEFTSLSPTEVKSRVGRKEKTLWKLLKDESSPEVISNLVVMLFKELFELYQNLKQSAINVSTLAANASTSGELLRRSKILAQYSKCDHSKRYLNQVRIAGREERWKNRDMNLAGGAGLEIVAARVLCPHCEALNIADDLRSMLITDGGTDTLFIRILRCISNTQSASAALVLIDDVTSSMTSARSVINSTGTFLNLLVEIYNSMPAIEEAATSRTSYYRSRQDRDKMNARYERFKAVEAESIYSKTLLRLLQQETSSSCNNTCDKCSVGPIAWNDIRVLVCGHVLCSSDACITASSRSCPVCTTVQPFDIASSPMLPPTTTNSFGTKMDAISSDIIKVVRKQSCLVFSQYQEALEMVQTVLRVKGVEALRYRGKVDDNLISEFQKGEKRVLLLPIRSCNHGINLPQAQHVFLLEPCLQTSLEEQAVARVRRLNQTEETFVHRYVVNNTVERPIYDVLHRSNGDKVAAVLTREKLYNVFTDYEQWY